MNALLFLVAVSLPSQARADFVGPPVLPPLAKGHVPSTAYQEQLKAELARRKVIKGRKAGRPAGGASLMTDGVRQQYEFAEIRAKREAAEKAAFDADLQSETDARIRLSDAMALEAQKKAMADLPANLKAAAKLRLKAEADAKAEFEAEAKSKGR
jgi:autotransporter translocation and assembly factor TamB